MKFAPYLIGFLMVAVLGYGLYLQLVHPRRILGYGQVTAKSRHTPGKTATLRTRDVEGSGATFKEVELPGGAWLDCRGDCAETARCEHLDVWETKREEGR